MNLIGLRMVVVGGAAVCAAVASAGPPSASFTNVATVDMTDVGGNARGAAWGDYDNDGDPDLYFTNWNGFNRLFENIEGIEFINRTTGLPTGPHFADLDGDGFVGSADLAHLLGSWGGVGTADLNQDGIVNAFDLALVLGDWDPPTLSVVGDPGATRLSGRAIWGDYDNDGDLDLFITASLGSALLRNDGPVDGFVNVSNGTSLELTGKLVRCASWGDYDNDGDLDLYASAFHGSNNANHLFRNDGADIFTDVTPPLLADDGIGRGVVFTDADMDGDIDLYVSNGMPGPTEQVPQFIGNHLYLNDGFGVFTDGTASPLADDASHGRGVAWGDYDNDGDFDLYLANVNVGGVGGGNKLLRNDGVNGFTDVTTTLLSNPRQTRECAWIDYDNDSDLDLFLANSLAENLLLRNDGAAGFVMVEAGLMTADVQDARAASWADYDGDGDMDVFTCNVGENYLFRNDLVSTNRWLEVRLTGTLSNRSAIGAKVMVTTGAVTQLREVRSGEGYLSQHMLTQHFGLGDAVIVDQIEIQWPSGQAQTLMNVSVDQIVDVVESGP